MKGPFVVWLPVAVASGVIACGASTSSKKANDTDGGAADAAPGAGGKTGTGGSSAAGGATAGGAGGAATTGGTPGSGGTKISDGGPDAPDIDASADASADAGICAPTPGDETHPTILSATKIAANQIALTFSEPVRVPAGLDPAKFRLSVGYTQNFEGPQDTTYYYDPSSDLDEDVSITSVDGDCIDTLVLTFAGGVTNSQMCAELAYAGSEFNGQNVGLFLHFTEAGSPTVQDRNQNDLLSAGADWVTVPDGNPLPSNLQLSGHFPDDPIPVSVKCTVPDGG